MSLTLQTNTHTDDRGLDEATLDAAVELAGRGVPVGATDWTAVVAGDRLTGRGAFGDAARVVLADHATPSRETDTPRSRLVSLGV